MAKYNVHQIKSDAPEEHTQQLLTLSAGEIEYWESEWKHEPLQRTPLKMVIIRDSLNISGDHVAYNGPSIKNLVN